MIWIYAAATLLGGAFLIPMLLGGLDTDADTDLGGGDVGGDVDLGGDLELDAGDLDVGGDIDGLDGVDGTTDGVDADLGAGPLGAIFASLVSFRTIVFFSAFFGVVGASSFSPRSQAPMQQPSATISSGSNSDSGIRWRLTRRTYHDRLRRDHRGDPGRRRRLEREDEHRPIGR